MDSKRTEADIADIFGVPLDANGSGSDSNLEVDPVGTFDEQVSDMKDDIFGDSSEIKTTETSNRDVVIDAVKKTEKITDETPENEEQKPYLELEPVSEPVAELVSEPISEPISEPVPEPVPELSDIVGPPETAGVSTVTHSSPFDSISNENSSKSFDWILSSKDPKFDPFYVKKREVLSLILSRGELDFDRLEIELKDSIVDASTRVFDALIICEKMQLVQKTKDRVAQIQTDINSQYFEWDRMVELLHGVLARTSYDKPKEKHIGTIFHHMCDMELYFARLKKLYKIADIIQKNLDSAYDTLSRQVTIAMPQKVIERVGSFTQNYETSVPHSNNVNESEVAPELAGYDVLKTSVSHETQESTKSAGAIKIGWDAVSNHPR